MKGGKHHLHAVLTTALKNSIIEKQGIVQKVNQFMGTREGRIFAHLPVLALIISVSDDPDQDGRIEWASDMWLEVTGWRRDELKGTSWRDYIHPDHLEVSNGTYSEQMAGERVVSFHNLWRTKGGAYLDFAWSATEAIDGLIYAVVRTFKRPA